MNHYVTGATIKSLRERQNLTQAQLAAKLHLSDKTISKWETGHGLPDISLLEPLSAALQVSLPELFSGEIVQNNNRAANMHRSKQAVCPVCGNLICSTGAAAISCCGIALPPLDAEMPESEDTAHTAEIRAIGHEIYVKLTHEMTKTHSIAYIAYCTDARLEVVRLYPEGTAEAYFTRRGRGILYWYCNQHGLFSAKV